MAFREYSMNSESKKATKIIEEHWNSDCNYHMKMLNENGCKVYVWFRICSCGKTELEDRSKVRWRWLTTELFKKWNLCSLLGSLYLSGFKKIAPLEYF